MAKLLKEYAHSKETEGCKDGSFLKNQKWEIKEIFTKYVFYKNASDYEKIFNLSSENLSNVLFREKEFVELCKDILVKKCQPGTGYPDNILIQEFSPEEEGLRLFAIENVHKILFILKQAVVLKIFMELYPFPDTSVSEILPDNDLYPAGFLEMVDKKVSDKYCRVMPECIEEIKKSLPNTEEETAADLNALWAAAKENVYMLIYFVEQLMQACQNIKESSAINLVSHCVRTLTSYNCELKRQLTAIAIRNKELKRFTSYSDYNYIGGVLRQIGIVGNRLSANISFIQLQTSDGAIPWVKGLY